MRSGFLMTRLSKTPNQAVLAGNTPQNAERGRLRGSHDTLKAMARGREVHRLSKILAHEKLSWTRVIFGTYVLGNAKLERLVEGCRWTEGPVWFGDANMLLFSDIVPPQLEMEKAFLR